MKKTAKQKKAAAAEVPGETKDAPPRQLITRDVVRAVLTLDDLYRRNRRWPLLSDADFAEQQAAHLVAAEGAPGPGRRNLPGKSPGPPIAEDLVAAQSTYHGSYAVSGEAPVTSARVQDVLYKWFPRLEALFEAAEGKLLAAGGAVAAALSFASAPADQEHAYRRQRPPHGCDVDLFLVGVAESDARALLEKVSARAFADQKYVYTRNFNAITVSIAASDYNSRPYQFILRLYERADLVLGGFDLPYCACGFNPNLGLVMTPAAAFSLSTGCILVDSARRSTTYEYRLHKYMGRQARIVFSSLTMPGEEVGTFEVGKLELRRGRHNNESIKWTIYKQPAGTEESQSDYGSDEHPCVISYSNILKAASATEGKIFSATVVAESMPELIDRPKVPGAIGLEKMYRRRATSQYERGSNVLVRYQRWFGADAPAFVMAKMTGDKVAMDAIVSLKVAQIEAILHEAARANSKPLSFLTVDPGRQWTGSFNPIDEPAADFYGTFYRPTLIGLPSFETVFLCKVILRGFPRDLFRLIVVGYVIPAICYHTLHTAGFVA